jgi:tetratricopeptide (TPR) repeat protein
MGAESIDHYDAGIATSSLGSLLPMLHAQVLAGQGQWPEALALFDAHFDASLADGLARMAAGLLADRAWCEWHLGKTLEAEALVAAAEQALLEPCDADDRAMAHARLAQVHAALGNPGAAQRHRDASLAHYAEHCEQQQRIAALLDHALAGLDPAAI